MFGRILYGNEQVVIDGYNLSGIQSIDASYSSELENIIDLTSGFLGQYSAQNIVGNFNITRTMVGTDPIRYLTGDVKCSGQIQYGGKSFGFQSGYLNSYRVEAGIGRPITISNNFSIFGDMGSGISGTTNIATPIPLKIANPGAMSIICDGVASNRILSFSYDYNINRKPLYSLNSQIPLQVKREGPINVSVNFELEVDDYQSQRMLNVLCSPHYKNISVNMSGVCGVGAIDSFSLISGRMVGEAVRSSITNPLVFSLTYKGIII